MKFETNYKPQSWQMKAHEFFESPKLEVLNLGGGTKAEVNDFLVNEGVLYFINCLNENRHVHHPETFPSVHWGIICSSEKNSKELFNKIINTLPKELIVDIYNNEGTIRTIRTINNSYIEICSPYKFKQINGIGFDLITITEASAVNNLNGVLCGIKPSSYNSKTNHKLYRNESKVIISGSKLVGDFKNLWLAGLSNKPEYIASWKSFEIQPMRKTVFPRKILRKKIVK